MVVGGSLVIAAALMACGSNPRLTPPPLEMRPDEMSSAVEHLAGSKRRALTELTFDDLMCRLDKRFHGFAGVEQDGGNLILSFAEEPPRNLEKVKTALSRAGVAVSGRPQVRHVHYSFCRLQSWYNPLASEALGLEGAVLSDIDEGRNDLYIGVDDLERWEPRVRAIARRLGVPQEVLRVGEEEPASY